MAAMSLRWSDQTVLITGATGLVGSGLARFAAAADCRVIVTGRDTARLAALSDVLGGVPSYVADLTETASLERLAANMQADAVVPTILVNNAADVTSKPFLDTSIEEIDHAIRVNVTATLQLSRLFAPAMIARGAGAIVNVSSLAGYQPNPAQTVYSASKGALNAASEALRAELGARGVHVVNVALMGVGTGPGRIPVEEVGRRVFRAIERREPDVFFYHSTKWLMRVYAAIPWLARRRAAGRG